MKSSSLNRRFDPRLIPLMVMLFFFAAMLPSPMIGVARASSTIVANSGADRISNDGECTLREAVRAANSDSRSGSKPGECAAGDGADTITLQPGVYTLDRTDNGKEDAASTGDLDITADLTIVAEGPGASVVRASAGFTDRLFHILGGQVKFAGLTLQEVAHNGEGAAVYNAASLTIEDSSLVGNQATGSGGAIFNAAGAILSLTNSTFSGNTSLSEGGAIYNAGGQATLQHITLTANQAASGGGLAGQAGGLTYGNSLIAGNTADDANADCAGPIGNSGGYNLLGLNTGCPADASDGGVNPAEVFTTVLGPLQDNTGRTFTHALLPGSPAIDAVPLASCTLPTDQRGLGRPGGAACDAGAFEVQDPIQVGPFVVNREDDVDDGLCTFNHCSLREAIQGANSAPNGAAPDSIIFNLPPAGDRIIRPLTALPAVLDPVVIDATTQPGGPVMLEGSLAGPSADGLTLEAGGSRLLGLTLQGFLGNGVVLRTGGGNALEGNLIRDNGGAGALVEGSAGNHLQDNTLTGNGGEGVRVLNSLANRVERNAIYDNALLGIDLGSDGVSANDVGDGDAGANGLQNTPIVYRPTLVAGMLQAEGRLNSAANGAFNLDFFANPACDPSGSGEGQTYLGSAQVATDSKGNVEFVVDLAYDPADGTFITATATGSDGSTSEFSACAVVSAGNDSWPRSFPLDSGVAVDQFIDRQGQSRWFHLRIEPNSKVEVTLTGLTANYDLLLYRDIAAAYAEMTTLDSTADLVRLNAEFAPDIFTPDIFTPDIFTPDIFTPDPKAFAAAQRSTLIGVSAFGGLTSEGIRVNTWNNTGDFFIRVRGRNGAFSLDAPFRLTATVIPGSCSAITDQLPASTFSAPAGGYRTVILTDFDRMNLTADERSDLQAGLATLAQRPEVAGLVVDLGAASGFERVGAANTQADRFPECPYAKNLVAGAIKEIVDRVWAENPLEYVAVVGNDEVIPFFRYPDQAGLANELNFVPPVLDLSSSQASLKLGYVLGQDEYGARHTVALKYDRLPVPELAVGRLVEAPAEILAVLEAYLSTSDGVITPQTGLVTGYDFLEDAANAVLGELEAGMGSPVDPLITPREFSPQDEDNSWNADDLRAVLQSGRHDLIYLAGHFSASSALAADYSTRLLTSDLAGAPPDQWRNVLVFSAGCHSGYNIVNAHDVPGITREPDWAQTFAGLGTTLIGGTGYQYGDTDFIEYSERLYHEFSRQLRTGLGPVSIGEALVTAKQVYLAETPQLRPLHEKALIESAIFGLPMLRFDMPGARLTPPSPSAPIQPVGFAADPGATLGLAYADLTVLPNLTERTQLEYRTDDPNQTVEVFYLESNGRFVSNAAEATLPLEVVNVTAPDSVLRGVGFREGSFYSIPNKIPLGGSPTTEIRGTHASFLADVYYPITPWSVNYFDALTDPSAGLTRLNVIAAQFLSDGPLSPTGTFRAYDRMAFRLYYSDYLQQAGGNRPGLAAPPAFTRILAESDATGVDFRLRVVGDPSAGVQEVWVTYTSLSGAFTGAWASLDLAQDPDDSTLWTGRLDLQGTPADELRYLVQAVNGVGVVSADANFGALHIPDVDPALGGGDRTELSVSGPASGAYGASATFTATLTEADGVTPIQSQPVTFSIGPQRRRALTRADGSATVELPLFGEPGAGEVRVTFTGNRRLAPASASAAFEIRRAGTRITLDPVSAEGFRGQGGLVVAKLADDTGRPLRERTVIFVLTGPAGSTSQAVITDYLGRAPLEPLQLPLGVYDLSAYFSGDILLDTGETIRLEDLRFRPSLAQGSLKILNRAPDCSAVSARPLNVWSPDKELHPVQVSDVIDPDGDPVQITITGIFQDEPVGRGKNSPDGFGVGTDTALIRAERDGSGNGRVYEIRFLAEDSFGGTCSAAVVLGIVPHDQSGDLDVVNDGTIYDSTVPDR